MPDEYPYILKILTGSQAGAEVSIAEAEYVLGSGSDDDLHFVDVSLKPGHARLRLEGGIIKAAGGAGTVKTRSGINILAGDETWHEIEALDVITIGTTCFAIGSPSDDWSYVENFSPPREAGNPALPPPIVTQPKWGSSRYAAVAGALVIVLFSFAWLVNAPTQDVGSTETVDERPDLAIVIESLKAFPFAENILVTQEVDGVIDANGYVDTPAERRALRNAIDKVAIPVRFRVWSRAVIENETQALIENQKIPIQFSVSTDGVMTLRGDVLDERRVDRLVATITESVAGVAQIDVRVQTASTYLQQIRELLARSELEDSVIVRLDGEIIEANGVVVANKIDNWVGFIQSYARRYADRIALRSFVQLVDENGQIIADPVSAQPGLPVIIGAFGGLEQVNESGQIIAEPVSAQPGTPIIDGEVTKSEQEAPTLSNLPISEELAGNGSALPSVDTNEGPATEITADPDDAAAFQPNQPGVLLDLGRLKEGSFGPEEIFRGFNTTAVNNKLAVQEASSFPSAEPQSNGGPRVQPASVATQPATLRPRLLNRASRPESIQGMQVLHNMTKAVLSNETGVPAPQAYVDDLTALGDVDATLDQLKHFWGPSFDLDASQDAYFRMLVKSPSADSTECWDNSIAGLNSLPYTLFWLDYLSVSDNVDVSAISIDAQVLLLEAALNPNRMAACAVRLSTEHEFDLSKQSLYLQESELNPEFIRFIVRQVSPHPFALSGVNMGFQNRYAQLINGVRFNEGASTDPSSLLVNVGELGLLIKERDRLRVTVYDQSLHWKSGG